MAPDDPASATLAAIARKLDFMRPDIEEPGSSPAARLIAGHAALLLAAVEAVLELADEIDNGGRTRSPVARASARILRERVRAALSGEEASDG